MSRYWNKILWNKTRNILGHGRGLFVLMWITLPDNKHKPEDNMASRTHLMEKLCSACVPMQMFLSHFSSSDRTLQTYSVYCLTANRAPGILLSQSPAWLYSRVQNVTVPVSRVKGTKGEKNKNSGKKNNEKSHVTMAPCYHGMVKEHNPNLSPDPHLPYFQHTSDRPWRRVEALSEAHPQEPLQGCAGHHQQDAEIYGRSSKISLSMGCKNREGRGAGLRDRSWKRSRESEGGRLMVEKECWEAGVGGRVGGDSTYLLRRFSAHSLGCGLLNV